MILDWDVAHPLMQYIRDLSTVVILKAIAVEPPVGSTVLIESNQGPLAFVVPREGYSDAVVTFALMDGEKFNTNWFQKYSFPLFLFNSLQVLGNSRESTGDEVHAPGQPVVLRVDSDAGQVEVTSPDGRTVERLTRTSQGTFVANETGTTGIYHARWGADGQLAFAVNQFDLRESDLAPRGLVPEGVPPAQADAYKIKIGYNPVVGHPEPQAEPQGLVEAPGGPGPRRRPDRVVHLQSPRLHLSRDRGGRRSRRWPMPPGWPMRSARGVVSAFGTAARRTRRLISGRQP